MVMAFSHDLGVGLRACSWVQDRALALMGSNPRIG
jgi:hypothetical protein